MRPFSNATEYLEWERRTCGDCERDPKQCRLAKCAAMVSRQPRRRLSTGACPQRVPKGSLRDAWKEKT